jgi:hypothetical protein
MTVGKRRLVLRESLDSAAGRFVTSTKSLAKTQPARRLRTCVMTHNQVRHIDRLQVSLSEKLDSKRIYDAQFFVQHANYNGDVVAAFQTYLRPSILTSTGHAYHIDLHLCRERDLFCGGGSP